MYSIETIMDILHPSHHPIMARSAIYPIKPTRIAYKRFSALNWDSIRKAIGMALMASCLVFFTTLVRDVMNVPKLWVASLGAAILLLEVRENLNSANRVWALFLGVYLTTTIFSVDPLLSAVGNYYCGWETLLLALLCYVTFVAGMEYRQDITKFIIAIIIVSCLYLIVQRISQIDDTNSYYSWMPFKFNVPIGGSGDWHMTGVMGNSGWSAGLLAMYVAWCPVWLMPLLGIALVLTKSRSAALAVTAALAWKYRGKIPLRVSIYSFLASLTFFLCFRHVSSLERIGFNIAAIKAWMERPWFGWGPGTCAVWYLRTRTFADQALMGSVNNIEVNTHNLITNIISTQGLFGLFAWGILLYAAWKVASEATKCAMVSIGTFSMFYPVPHVAYVLIAISCGVDVGRGRALQPCGKFMRYMFLCLGLFIFYRYSVYAIADHYDSIGRSDIAARIEPNEFYYSQKVKVVAEKSMQMHRENPLAYYGAIKSLINRGKEKEARIVDRIAKSMDHTGRIGVAK